MNKKISLVMIMIFVSVFSSLFVFDSIFANMAKDEFYAQEFDSTEKIFIYGSSHVIQLNNTLIETEIQNNSLEYTLINMGEGSDRPEFRFSNIENDIELEPKAIFYGIGFRDLSDWTKTEKDEGNGFSIKYLVPTEFASEIETMNPKLTTLEVLRSIVLDIISEKESKKVPYPDNSVFQEKKIEKIVDSTELMNRFLRDSPLLENQADVKAMNNIQLEYLKKIIEKLQENDIQMVLFLTPYCTHYLESYSQEDKNNFFLHVDNLKKEFNIEVYDFSSKYQNLPIWKDCDHVAYNPDSMIFTEDVSQMVIKELKK